MAGEKTPYDPTRTLPVHRAFVVHFADGPRGGRFTGRVEHLASGVAAEFGSLQALLAFVARLLDAPSDP